MIIHYGVSENSHSGQIPFRERNLLFRLALHRDVAVVSGRAHPTGIQFPVPN
jgi:hypothetical protein